MGTFFKDNLLQFLPEQYRILDENGSVVLSYPQWEPAKAYTVDDIVKSADHGNRYIALKCTSAGTSGATEPGWPEDKDETVNDGTVVWTAVLAQNLDLTQFMKILAIPIDEFDDLINDFPSIIDVDNADAKYLPYIARMLNYPLSDRDTEARQRLQLRQAVNFYRRKGMEESFRILFYALGYTINLVELWTYDYQQFFRYPGTFLPQIFQANLNGATIETTLDALAIDTTNNRLRIQIDGFPPNDIWIPVGETSLATIASLIDSHLVALQTIGFVSVGDQIGTCTLVIDDAGPPEKGHLQIKSNLAGADSQVRTINVQTGAYSAIGLIAPTFTVGIDRTVPDDWPELLENTDPITGRDGRWYKSPHFAIEVQNIEPERIVDGEEFNYIRSRIELVRPAHTVLDAIDYYQLLIDLWDGKDDPNPIGTIIGPDDEQWPFPICFDRGDGCEPLYYRDGFAPSDRGGATSVAWKHKRLSLDDCPTRSEFDYTYTLLDRSNPAGHPDMQLRGDITPHREQGIPEGNPTRSACAELEILEIEITGGLYDEDWCAVPIRQGGAYFRDNPTDYLRDGSFSQLNWGRATHEFHRDGESDPGFDRTECKPVLEADLHPLFYRSDLPSIYFPTLGSMNDPDIIPPGGLEGGTGPSWTIT